MQKIDYMHYSHVFLCAVVWRDSLVVSVLDYTIARSGFQSRWRLAAGGRVATVGQLLFAPWAWVYSTLHPFRVGK